VELSIGTISSDADTAKLTGHSSDFGNIPELLPIPCRIEADAVDDVSAILLRRSKQRHY
jgi:hypothetical protein